ncbi:formylglycine-generating enzyme required for sulfatase activity [Chitinophaga skermanii]|uniref:Formylglycine-generating enzyme required for sulfatase activity n=1 Tax=Chitinophaga skermanii TaxID=331697 RepID=A0A327Q472_9BACT|nr:SUMF1/EgtB/PvdO family nonheme iron enzyme [Chitinophaga skermanii]RAI98714.1 formylglycine-generating enzyme required for sulfatase activity [Chitinophaga skermanii]
MKKSTLLFLGGFIPATLLAQTNTGKPFEAYTQTIPGTQVSFKMQAIQGGEFLMGSPSTEKSRNSNEGPQKKVTLAPFFIGTHEVTFDAYDVYADEEKDKSPLPDGMTRPSPPYIDLTLGMGKSGGFPANSMSQYGALMYCRWLYEKTGIFYRLPTEAEWEYACRAGASTPYNFGNDSAALGDYAWYKANSGNVYHKVGQKKPNAWGLYDMLGNVAEWTMDQYDEQYFTKVDANNPVLKATTKTPRTIKGGHFQDDARSLRSAARLKSDINWNRRDPQIPKSKWWNADSPFIGFRLVSPKDQPTKEEAQQFFEDAINKFIGAR